MDKFKTLEPVKLYSPSASRSSAKTVSNVRLIGKLPADLHILVLTHLPIPDIPAYSLCSRATAELSKDERVWKDRWIRLGVEKHDLSGALNELESRSKGLYASSRASAPPTLPVDSFDDEFGDFASVDTIAPSQDEMGDFVGGFGQPVSLSTSNSSKPNYRSMYIRAHSLLKPLTHALSSPTHLLLSSLFPPPSPTLRFQSETLRLLSLFLSGTVQPLTAYTSLRTSLRQALDRFEANLLSAFDAADSQGNEHGMQEAADASWRVWEGTGEWELSRTWGEKREIFYEQGRWKPLDNFTKDGDLAFDAMDEFMRDVLSSIRTHGSRAVRVFPPASHVLLSFAERIANEVIAEYITSLLTRAREISNETFLKATAASFKESWRLVDAIIETASQRSDSLLTQTQAEDVIYRMFEANMDEYLDEEVESVKQQFELICRTWSQQISQRASAPASSETTRFLGSQNPAQVKRNLLASFTDVLLLPVTIVPRTVGAVGAVLTTGGTAAVQGIAMLNPQRWGASAVTPSGVKNGYTKDFRTSLEPGNVLFESGRDDEDEDFDAKKSDAKRSSQSSQMTLDTSTSTQSSSAKTTNLDKLELLLSLDTALELIHADREALKRVETFSGYPGHYGHRVHDTVEEIFILLLQTMSERHLSPGFAQAIDRMHAYKPAEHGETTSVAPLLQFFELVHIGDTMQSMVQVYFDKELAPRIDRTDFLNPVVREKKRFENALDDSVAGGLNAGTEVLMTQVEHIIITQTKLREYCPPEDAPPLELGPTKGCSEAIRCLEIHCKLLKGSTSKEVLEVFYQEVGFRLIAILQKHIKRQIISLTGGFQVIADLNAYHSFILSLRVASVASEFSHLKMLGHVYVVEDAKDLAQIVRDVTRYGGAYRPEDIYEFIQRRADWKQIEKTVDKTMYNLSFKEDCVIC
ncbi:hypothetical protein JAAARDRAFT_160970 [Jaapia argillacea MUCL 33604]|uniref:F-box domain-containing protein n=1 Tax=Jaapia argillacea MUCL 33604 TaxID=933084 RepID=A0A067PUL5_9AGAM|nr:hypothetical protein JAAARDRAFT_160970 [Jaapia argillacea MUCL 33604]